MFEGGSFAVMAVGVHLLFVGMAPEDAGSSSAGEGGEAMLSMQASSESIEALVDDWDTPPETSSPVVELVALTAPPLTPQLQMEPAAEIALPRTLTPAPRFETPHLRENVSLPSQALLPPQAQEPTPELEALSKIIPQLRPIRRPAPTNARTTASSSKATPKSVTTSPARAAQKSAGSGGTTSAGTARAASNTAAQSSSASASELVKWKSAVRARIERRKRGVGAVGNVKLQITVARTGALRNAKVIGPSGNRKMDIAALNAVKSAGKFPRAPSSATNASHTFNFTMRFK
jgi:protein TonB